MPWFRLLVLHVRDNGKICAQKANGISVVAEMWQMTQDFRESGGKRLVKVPQ